jgi:hypothetical protein
MGRGQAPFEHRGEDNACFEAYVQHSRPNGHNLSPICSSQLEIGDEAPAFYKIASDALHRGLKLPKGHRKGDRKRAAPIRDEGAGDGEFGMITEDGTFAFVDEDGEQASEGWITMGSCDFCGCQF